MIIAKPLNQNSPLHIRCRNHTEARYLCTIYLDSKVIYIFAPNLIYNDGFLDGNIALPFTEDQESQFCKARLFSIMQEAKILTDIAASPEGYLIYDYEQYLDLILELTSSSTVEDELWRGVCFVTDKEDFEKYRLTSDFIY